MSLTPEQVDLFHHNGFLKLPARLPDAIVHALRETIHRNMRDAVEPAVRDKTGRVVRISQIWDREPIFRDVAAGPPALEALQAVLGPDILLIRNRHNHATLNLTGTGGDYWHRDVGQWTRSIVTIIFYLEDATVEKGCTRIIPGTHRLRWFPDASTARGSRQVEESGLLDQEVPVPMEAGQMLLLNSLLLHRVGTNRTSETRMSMTFGYHGADELDDAPNPQRVLISGQALYAGNDRSRAPAKPAAGGGSSP